MAKKNKNADNPEQVAKTNLNDTETTEKTKKLSKKDTKKIEPKEPDTIENKKNKQNEIITSGDSKTEEPTKRTSKKKPKAQETVVTNAEQQTEPTKQKSEKFTESTQPQFNSNTETSKKTDKSTSDKKTLKTKQSYPEKIDYRLQQIQFQLNYEKVEGIYVSYLPNIRYLTNFSGSDAHLFIFKDKILFITDDRYEEQIKTELYPLPNMQTIITRDVWGTIEELKILENYQEIAFESDRLSYQSAVDYRNKIRPVKFKPTPELVEPTTRSKAPEELEYIRQACTISEKVFTFLLNFIKPGMSERDIAIEIAYQSRKMGSEGDAFDIIVTSGPRGALVHGQPSDRKIRKGDIVIIDFGCKVNGFCSDITRTICVGAKPTKEQKSMYSLLRSAQKRAIEILRPGINGKVVDMAARKIIQDAGFGDYFKHSLGHGIGIVPHEKPIITFRRDDQNVPEDAVVAIEPGIYLPEKYGMRVEDNIHVTKNGPVWLTNASDELIYT